MAPCFSTASGALCTAVEQLLGLLDFPFPFLFRVAFLRFEPDVGFFCGMLFLAGLLVDELTFSNSKGSETSDPEKKKRARKVMAEAKGEPVTQAWLPQSHPRESKEWGIEVRSRAEISASLVLPGGPSNSKKRKKRFRNNPSGKRPPPLSKSERQRQNA